MEQPWQSTYAAFNNNPIIYTDPLGLKAGGGGPKKGNPNLDNNPMSGSYYKPQGISLKAMPSGNSYQQAGIVMNQLARGNNNGTGPTDLNNDFEILNDYGDNYYGDGGNLSCVKRKSTGENMYLWSRQHDNGSVQMKTNPGGESGYWSNYVPDNALVNGVLPYESPSQAELNRRVLLNHLLATARSWKEHDLAGKMEAVIEFTLLTAITMGLAPEALAVRTAISVETSEAVAANVGTKLLPQFTSNAIEEGVSYVMNNKVIHIFNKSMHNLGALVTKLGGQKNTVRAVLNAANGKLPSSELFKDVVVNVAGYDVYIRGQVINGVPKIGTMFIK